MEHFFFQYGLLGLFGLAFLAATLFPVASEAALVALVASGMDPAACVLVATVGNTLGAVTTWGVGKWGSSGVLSGIFGLAPERRGQAERLFGRFGVWSLFLSWAPLIGDALCFVAGIFALPFFRFLPPVFLGKLARYAVLAWFFTPAAVF